MLIDKRRTLIVPGDEALTIAFCCDHFCQAVAEAVEDHGGFFVALSGGSTPKAIFERLTAAPYTQRIDWTRVHLFWGDERAVPPESSESNYRMAMAAGLEKMPIPAEQIHRMRAESAIEKHAQDYEEEIKKELGDQPFDLIMLGMGEDGHTVSLFPGTKALEERERLVVANAVPQKKSWRMTLTYPCINRARSAVFYVIGGAKKQMLARVLAPGEALPSQRIGTEERPALWIADAAAAALIERPS